MKKEEKILAYEIVGHKTRYTTCKKQAEGLAAYHCGNISEQKVLVPFTLLVSKFDEDYVMQENNTTQHNTP